MQAQRTNKTAAVFVDDGAEDAYEFSTNYIWFDPSDPSDVRRAWSEARALYESRCSRLPAGAPSDFGPPRVHGVSGAVELSWDSDFESGIFSACLRAS